MHCVKTLLLLMPLKLPQEEDIQLRHAALCLFQFLSPLAEKGLLRLVRLLEHMPPDISLSPLAAVSTRLTLSSAISSKTTVWMKWAVQDFVFPRASTPMPLRIKN